MKRKEEKTQRNRKPKPSPTVNPGDPARSTFPLFPDNPTGRPKPAPRPSSFSLACSNPRPCPLPLFLYHTGPARQRLPLPLARSPARAARSPPPTDRPAPRPARPTWQPPQPSSHLSSPRSTCPRLTPRAQLSVSSPLRRAVATEHRDPCPRCSPAFLIGCARRDPGAPSLNHPAAPPGTLSSPHSRHHTLATPAPHLRAGTEPRAAAATLLRCPPVPPKQRRGLASKPGVTPRPPP